MEPIILKLSASQTRRYGNVEQSFSIEGFFEVSQAEDRQKAYAQLNTVLAQEFGAFEMNFLPKQQDDNDKDTVTWAGGTLIRIIEGNSTRYALKTGKYMKFGAAVYDEVLPQFPPFPEGSNEIDLKDYGGKIWDRDGKKAKVISCRHVQP